MQRRVYQVIRRIPKGRVATYGQIAALAGRPRCARQVGQALRAADPKDRIPWQRVVNCQGRVSIRSSGEGSEPLQRALLEAEGVRFDESGRIDLSTYRWDPGPSLAFKASVNEITENSKDR